MVKTLPANYTLADARAFLRSHGKTQEPTLVNGRWLVQI